MAKRTRRTKLEMVDTSTLHAELQRRQRSLAPLEAKHNSLLIQLEDLEAEIEMLKGAGTFAPAKRGRPAKSGTRKAARGSARVTGRKRPKNAMKLDDSLAKLLKGKTMGVSEAAAAVQKAGYKTSAANFRTIVNQTMLKSPKIKKVSRGQYTAK